MSVITTYPIAVPQIEDLLLGTEIKEDGNLTKNFTISSLIELTENSILQNGWSGSFLTNDVLQVTVANGVITNVQTVG